MTAALTPARVAGMSRHVDRAIEELRSSMDYAAPCGPALVPAYRALAAAYDLKEWLQSLPVVTDPDAQGRGCENAPTTERP